MTLPEIFGYLASGLVFTSFCMKTMIPLRLVAVASNLAFMVYGLLLDLVPIFALHAVLLPMNVWRLAQLRQMIRQAREAADGDLSLDWLLPYMSRRPFRKGEVLFRRGEQASEMFYIVDGLVRLKELGITVGRGELIGEIGMFSPSKERLASAVCESDGELLAISEQKVTQLYFQNRKFGFYMIRLITQRLIEDLAIVQARHVRADPIKVSRVNGVSTIPRHVGADLRTPAEAQ
jgi:CRP/FNR family cyclic AMP-dependent transcriptional regulator